MEVAKDVFSVGVVDRDVRVFEAQYPIPLGMAYNSYFIKDEKIAVLDSVGEGYDDLWLSEMDRVLEGRSPDYLIVQHMEPDHSANIDTFLTRYPEAKVVASPLAFCMMRQFFGKDYADRRVMVDDDCTLSLGTHTLRFFTAPMVHWPEVIFTFDETAGTLFTADAFGRFGTTDPAEGWDDEARRYYFAIVGKYGMQVDAVLDKVGVLPIKAICPLHGPVLKENISHALALYRKWANYTPEAPGIVIAYTTVYGHTEAAVKLLKEELEAKTKLPVTLHNLIKEDLSYAMADAFRYHKLVLATTTYNADIFPPMRRFLEALEERGFQNRTVALIENGSWVPQGKRVMTELLSHMENIRMAKTSVTLRSALDDNSRAAVKALAEELA